MPGRAGSKLSWPVAFRNRQRLTGCDWMRIEHQHLANFFFMRSTAAAHRLSRRDCASILCGQSDIAQISAGGRGSRRRNLRRIERQRLQSTMRCRLRGRSSHLRRRLHWDLKTARPARHHVRSRWNHDRAFQGQRLDRTAACRGFRRRSYFRSVLQAENPVDEACSGPKAAQAEQSAARSRAEPAADGSSPWERPEPGWMQPGWAVEYPALEIKGSAGTITSVSGAAVLLIDHHNFLRRVFRICLLCGRSRRGACGLAVFTGGRYSESS